ncbi:phosphate acetyltransferase [Corynebacterium uterequi]|uniref:Phosphate acetyltransferase n=1 Tax=Corynebacterium uterequi TaxID=1072256 RepID=A0A0G3HEZ0_9CORY|nr:phosphate acetyltransferase [Corynebacterium uterequi]AKK11916.1 phosphate acetyltransferase [Corynebacterium uterequi]
MSHHRCLLLTVVGRNFDGLELDALAQAHNLTHIDITAHGATVDDVLNTIDREAEALYVGSGNQSLDARVAAALGAPMVIVNERHGVHVDLFVAQAEKLGAVVAETCNVTELPGAVERALATPAQPVMSPSMYGHILASKAREAKSHIVLPEGSDDRILQAADQILRRGIAELTILGDERDITLRAAAQHLDLSKAHIIDHLASPLAEEFARDFAELRKAKGVTLEQARETMKDLSYFATMMVHKGLADGMVSGAVNTTAHTIRPAFQIIKTRPGISVVSSVFLMVMRKRLWAFGDCAVNPNPTADQLGEIAVASADTAAAFGIDPRVAMLSYSTGTSGSGPDVDRVVAAVEKARSINPGLKLEGPIQFDAAIDPVVAAQKLPNSEVAGQANVYIFPDLEAGNIAYKAVQRTAGALAVGPILQGLNKPVNDLSRGATVPDIVNTVAVTAIQAGGKK